MSCILFWHVGAKPNSYFGHVLTIWSIHFGVAGMVLVVVMLVISECVSMCFLVWKFRIRQHSEVNAYSITRHPI